MTNCPTGSFQPIRVRRKRPVTSHIWPRHTESTVYTTSAYERRSDETNFHFSYSVKVQVHTERWQTAAEHLDERQERRELDLNHIWLQAARKRPQKHMRERERTQDEMMEVMWSYMCLSPEKHQLGCISSNRSLELLNRSDLIWITSREPRDDQTFRNVF